MSARVVDPPGEAGHSDPSRRFAPMRARDVAEVVAIEHRNYGFPWSEGIFRDCLKAGYQCQLMYLGDTLIGYGILQTGADEAHILNLCIDVNYQHQGHAVCLLTKLLDLAVRAPADIVFLEVRPSNPRAISLYQQNGFNEIGMRRDYYDSASGREDALVMARSLKGYTGAL